MCLNNIAGIKAWMYETDLNAKALDAEKVVNLMFDRQ